MITNQPHRQELRKPRFLLFSVVFLIFIFSPLLWLSQTNPVFQAKTMIFSLSPGVRYFGHLRLWHLLAKDGNWSAAAKIAPNLDPADIADYLNPESPPALKIRFNNLSIKANKTATDYVEMAKIQAKLNNRNLAVKLLDQAIAADPIRTDLSILRYQISH
jgi:hypothetical protein